MKTFQLLVLALFVSLASCSTDDSENTSESPIADNPMMTNTSNSTARTTIPDTKFEEYLVSINADDIVDGSVITENLSIITEIVVDDMDITDLSGIEDCPNLFNLWLQDNNVSSLNVSNNPLLKFIYADGNNLTSINVSSLPLLEKLSLRNNMISSIDVAINPALQLLEINGNAIGSVDVSANDELFRFDIRDNPLTCIQVNETQLSSIPTNWNKDMSQTYALDCD